MDHFVDHFSRDVQPKGCDVTVLRHSFELRSPPPYSRTRAEYVKTCIRHNDTLCLCHQQSGRQQRHDCVYLTAGALISQQSKSSTSMKWKPRQSESLANKVLEAGVQTSYVHSSVKQHVKSHAAVTCQ